MEKYGCSYKKYRQTLADSKIMRTFAPVFEKRLLDTAKDGPFVYRLGRKIFILERGVRFSHGLLPKTTSAKAEKKDGPFVYRLGRKIFILERGVRFSHGLLPKTTSAKAEKKDGPFVYRLGRKIFILERGVRFSHGLPKKGYPRNRVTLFLFRKNFTIFAGKHI